MYTILFVLSFIDGNITIEYPERQFTTEKACIVAGSDMILKANKDFAREYPNITDFKILCKFTPEPVTV